MRILHINVRYGYEGGIEQYLANVTTDLLGNGHEVFLIAGKRDPGTRYLNDQNIFVVPGILNVRPVQDLETANRLVGIISKLRPDLIFLHHMANPFLIESLLEFAPVVRFVHMEDIICPMVEKSFIKDWTPCVYRSGVMTCGILCPFFHRHGSRQPLEILSRIKKQRNLRKFNTRANAWVVASEFMRQSLLREGYPAEKINVIPYFTRMSEDSQDPPQVGGSQVFFSGRLVHSKGVDHLIHAMALLPSECRLLIAGDGPQRQELENLSRQLGLADRIQFLGFVPNEELSRYRNKSAVVVVPSLFQEPFGIVGIEAMAAGKPVVAYNVGGVSQWLEDGVTGYCVKPKDIDLLSRRVHQLITDPELATTMGNLGKLSVKKNFLAHRHLERLEALFKNVIGQ